MSGLSPILVSSFISPTSSASNIENKTLYDAITYIYQEVVSANFFQFLKQKAVWVWNATIEALKSEWMAITLVAFAAFAVFGFACAVQSALVFTCARLAVVAWQDQGSQKDVEQLKGENLSLKLRNEEIVQEMEIERQGIRHAQDERNLHLSELERVKAVRDGLILDRAPILNENDRLREENIALLQERAKCEKDKKKMEEQIQSLQVERDEAVQEKEKQEGGYHRAVQNAEQFAEQLNRVKTFENFNRLLSELKEVYQGRQERYTPGACQQLFNEYKAIRNEWNQKLSELIRTLNPNSKETIRLEKILAVSQGELEHLEQLYAVMQLHIVYEAQKMQHSIAVERQPVLIEVRG